jgi:AbrB family looped-hinge helix DNA binding protein
MLLAEVTESRTGRLSENCKAMSTIIRIQKKGQVVIPRSLREQVGVAEGDLLEVKVQGSQFLLTPKLVISRELITGPKQNPKQRREEFVRQVKVSAPRALKNIWEESKRKGLDKLTMRQIDAIISEVRQEQKFGETAEQPAK